MIEKLKIFGRKMKMNFVYAQSLELYSKNTDVSFLNMTNSMDFDYAKSTELHSKIVNRTS